MLLTAALLTVPNAALKLASFYSWGMQKALQLHSNGMRWVGLYWTHPGCKWSTEMLFSTLTPMLGAGGWGQTGAQQSNSSLSQCDTSLLVPAESCDLCFAEMKHRLLYWDGTALGHSHTWLCLFHYLSFILWCSLYQKYNNKQTDRLNKPESVPKDSIRIELKHLVRSNKQNNSWLILLSIFSYI